MTRLFRFSYTRIFSLRSNSRIKRILTDLFLLYISFLGHDARISPSSTCKTHPKISSKSFAHRFKHTLKLPLRSRIFFHLQTFFIIILEKICLNNKEWVYLHIKTLLSSQTDTIQKKYFFPIDYQIDYQYF